MVFTIVPHKKFPNSFNCMVGNKKIAYLRQNMNGAMAPADTTYYVRFSALHVPYHLTAGRNMSIQDIADFLSEHQEEIKLVR